MYGLMCEQSTEQPWHVYVMIMQAELKKLEKVMKKFHSPCWPPPPRSLPFVDAPLPPFTGPWCLVYPNARVMGRDRRCCWERPGKLMWRPAARRAECFLFKVIKSSDHRESGSHRSADERKMKHKHEAGQQRLMCTSRNPFSCVLQGGTRVTSPVKSS